jgi:two-component system, NtrC family, nitrogen regulation sensor histidine kinase NtrY
VVRLPAPNKTELNLNDLVKRVATLFEFKAVEKRIQFELQIGAKPFKIYADQQQLEQALINVIKNGMEAIQTDGKIVIATNPGTSKLTITDTGAGIASEHVEHVFSPFFSTKKDGQGVGLTLVKEILLNHGFQFSLKTVAVAETVFEIEFKK